MKILLSPHMDTVRYPFKLGLSQGVHTGLLDNMVGVLATYAAIYGNQSVLELVKNGKIDVFHNWHEEFSLQAEFPEMSTQDLVIVIDVCSGASYSAYDFVIENYKGVDHSKFFDWLFWEGFNFRTKPFDGVDGEDEAWQWVQRGIPVLSFIIPIESPNDNWHGEESKITSEKLSKAVLGLQRLICCLTD